MSTDTRLTEATLREARDIAEGTMAFRFAKPEGFAFKAGQAIDLDVAGERHAFSIVTAPFEDDIMIATRMRDSAFKRGLRTVAPGTSLGIDGPFGSLTLHKSPKRAAVFIAGGIGITPFVSMLRQAARDGFPQPIALVYSNRRPEDTAFLEELEALARAHSRFRLVATMTEMEKSKRSWDGERRLVDADLLKSAAQGLADPIYYVAGPPAMVAAMRTALTAAGVEDDDIRAEDFFGY
jgi:ferredoxin-NADP reductase